MTCAEMVVFLALHAGSAALKWSQFCQPEWLGYDRAECFPHNPLSSMQPTTFTALKWSSFCAEMVVFEEGLR